MLIADSEAACDSLGAEGGAARAEGWVGDRGRPCCEVIFAVFEDGALQRHRRVSLTGAVPQLFRVRRACPDACLLRRRVQGRLSR